MIRRLFPTAPKTTAEKLGRRGARRLANASGSHELFRDALRLRTEHTSGCKVRRGILRARRFSLSIGRKKFWYRGQLEFRHRDRRALARNCHRRAGFRRALGGQGAGDGAGELHCSSTAQLHLFPAAALPGRQPPGGPCRPPISPRRSARARPAFQCDGHSGGSFGRRPRRLGKSSPRIGWSLTTFLLWRPARAMPISDTSDWARYGRAGPQAHRRCYAYPPAQSGWLLKRRNPNRSRHRRSCSIFVFGGGPTGVEMAGAIGRPRSQGG